MPDNFTAELFHTEEGFQVLITDNRSGEITVRTGWWLTAIEALDEGVRRAKAVDCN